MNKETLAYLKEKTEKGETIQRKIKAVEDTIQLAIAISKFGGSFTSLGVEIQNKGNTTCKFDGGYNIIEMIHNTDWIKNNYRQEAKDDKELTDILVTAIIEYGEKRLEQLQKEFEAL
jgi:hypothetical protein